MISASSSAQSKRRTVGAARVDVSGTAVAVADKEFSPVRLGTPGWQPRRSRHFCTHEAIYASAFSCLVEREVFAARAEEAKRRLVDITDYRIRAPSTESGSPRGLQDHRLEDQPAAPSSVGPRTRPPALRLFHRPREVWGIEPGAAISQFSLYSVPSRKDHQLSWPDTCARCHRENAKRASRHRRAGFKRNNPERTPPLHLDRLGRLLRAAYQRFPVLASR
jgi:hypothetical protein